MAGALKYTLVVRHPETGEPTALLAGQDVPTWAANLVHSDDFEGATDSPTPRRSSARGAAKSKPSA